MKILVKTIVLGTMLMSSFIIAPFSVTYAGALSDIFKNARESIKKNTKESINEAEQDISGTVDTQLQETTRHIQETTDKSIKSATSDVNEVVTDVNQAVNEGIAMTVDAATDTLNGNKNPIAAISIEGVFIGHNAAKASNVLTSAGYQQVSNNPMIFQKGTNILSVSTKDNKINSITLDGFANIDTSFVKNEKLRIEEALGKACPPVEQASNWLCAMEGESNEYLLEFQVKRNKFSYFVEGVI